MRFDLGDLRLFLAVVDAGSITHGAAAVNLSLAAASERLLGMEAAGGAALLVRGRRGASPTRAGEVLAHHARAILRQVSEMRTELSEHASGVHTTVRMLASTAAITEMLPERIGPWLAANPQIDVDLSERPSVETVKAIATGLADLGIVSDAVDIGALHVRMCAPDRLVAVMAVQDPLASARRVTLAELLERPLIGLTGALQSHIDDHALRAGRPFRPRIRLRTFEGVCRVAATGAGIGIVSETAARRCRRAMRLGIVPLSDAWASRRLLACCREPQELHRAAASLLDYLTQGPAL
ncbi:LysR family transcriptional regulator [Hephaestia caeni]|uniref:LysR family transcriptional regulator n=1 Tax=Hephaestia caeni TaxID=645617 RepID=A0A397PBB2_9SPHN|nr:LysR family transcriptional regulator [Hephaestia caeni]RIA46382.1 LysR family transcriptional regulator [Hephaestia caeni]